METNTSNVILYCRVSTDEQAQKGFSLNNQSETLLKFCETNHLNVLKVCREDHSGKNFNRPQWKELLAFIKGNKNSVDKILFLKWDRFARNLTEALNTIAKLKAMGITVNAIEEPIDMSIPQNLYMLAMYLTSGEVERSLISERTSNGIHTSKKEGYFPNKAPYGYDNFRNENEKKSTIIPNKDAHFVTRAFKEVAMDIEPIETTRVRLQRDGMKLEKSAFNVMLKKILYAGKMEVPEYKKELATLVDARHEALIDMATFQKVQCVFKGKRWQGLKSHKNLEFPLRDFLTCEVCGRQITGSFSKGRSKKYGYYHCRQKCKTRLSTEQTHIKISSLLVNIQINPNIKELFGDVLKDSEAQINGDKVAKLQLKIERQRILKANVEEAEDMLMRKDIAPDRFNSIVSRINTELMNVNMEIEVLKSSSDSIKGYVDEGLELLANLDLLFIESGYEGKRILVGSLFNKKLLFGNNGCRTTEVNEVLDVLTRNSNGFEGGKNRKAIISDSFSATVPSAGVEPAQFPTGV